MHGRNRRRLWRAGVAWLPYRIARWLVPGFEHLDAFCRHYVALDPEHRAGLIEMAFRPEGSLYLRAFRRAGGFREGFALIFPDGLPRGASANFATPENPTPTLDQVAASVVQVGTFGGLIPEDLRR